MNRIIKNFSKHTIKRILLAENNYETIKEAKQNLNVKTAEEAYTQMMNKHNIELITTRKNKKNQDARLKRQANKIIPEKDQNFMLDITVHIQFKDKELPIIRPENVDALLTGVSLIENVEYKIDYNFPYLVRDIKLILTDKLSHIPKILKDYHLEDSVKIQIPFSHTVQIQTPLIGYTPQENQFMRNAFIIRNDWLKFSKGIAEMAYEETENKCVYHQLNKYLLTERGGRRPTKFINKVKTSENALFEYFQSIHYGLKYNEGVNTAMIALLCKLIKRNMYAFDADDKIFSSITEFSSKHYAPIVFYKLNNHLYLIDDPKVIRSVAETNKEGKKVVSTSIDDVNEKENLHLQVSFLDKFPLDNIHQLEEGIYLLKQSNISKETIQYIIKYKSVPMTKNKDNVIISISVENEKKQKVYIAIDTNYIENIEYDTIKNVAETNFIKYVNEGIGSVISKIINGIDKREHLNDTEKTDVLMKSNNVCAICNLKSETYEIDHITKGIYDIKPLACGGSNKLDNLQALCPCCHKEKTTTENEMGIYQVRDELDSCFSEVVCNNIINTPQFKSYQFVEIVNETFNNDTVYKNDIVKCRRNIVLNNTYDIPVYSVMDYPTAFSGEIKTGYYYVKTDNAFPFRGNGWYSQPLVEYGINCDIIHLNQIILEFKPSFSKPSSYLRDKVELLLKSFSCEPSLQKLCANAYFGLMGKTKQTSSYSKFTLSVEEASNWYVDRADWNVFIHTHHIDDNYTLYEGIFNKKSILETTQYPIYSMILQMEALELHKLETIIKNKGGYILDRNTDAIRYCADEEIKLDGYLWCENTPKYQTECPKPLLIEHLPRLVRSCHLDKIINLDWEVQYDYDDIDSKVKEIVSSNKSIHIDGRAGTGKTFFANKLLEELDANNKKYICLSPTNKGARLINGKTIHSYYYTFQHNKRTLFKILKTTDYIVIDEVSMMIEKFYQLFMICKRAFNHLKFIIIGDFAQLPPVGDKWEGDYKNSSALWDLCDSKRIQLVKCRRADDKLFQLCKNVNNIDIDDFIPKVETYLNLAYTHQTRIKINNKCMLRFLKEYNVNKYVSINADPKNPKTQNIKLAVGMPVICHTTNKKLNCLNSEKFKVIHITKDTIILGNLLRQEPLGPSVLENNVEVDINKFNQFFYLGFCITIHSSQGETFNEPYTIYDWNFNRFCEKTKYVALSRGTNINNIQICK